MTTVGDFGHIEGVKGCVKAVTFTGEKFCLSTKVTTVADFGHIEGVKGCVKAAACTLFLHVGNFV